jgi:hypothetical protein
MKKETLEEAAEKYAESNQYGLEYYDEGGYQGIEVKSFAEKLVDFTTKWQQERMYSEEEIYSALQKLRLVFKSGVQKWQEDFEFDLDRWFEQFKKK